MTSTSQTTDRDPVCGMMLEAYDAVVRRQYGGKTYHFCSPVCRERFDQDPGRYGAAAALDHVLLVVVGLSCGSDATRLEHRLAGLDGVDRVTVNPLTETAYVTFDPNRLSLMEMKQTIRDAGYRVA